MRRWKAYAFNIAQYVESQGGIEERMLWHGTSQDTIGKIAVQGSPTFYAFVKPHILHPVGFLRQFGTRQAYGDGVYFARDSSYSISDSYSAPDRYGYKRMFYARVLTGEYHQGMLMLLSALSLSHPHSPNTYFPLTHTTLIETHSLPSHTYTPPT